MANKYEQYSKEQLYSEDVICQIMDEGDLLIREQMKFDLLDRAEEFGKTVVKRVESMLKIAEKDMKQKKKAEQQSPDSRPHENFTEYEGIEPMRCGKWEANMHGVYNPNAFYDDRLVCSHPIYPEEVITNIEDNTQKIRLMFYRSSRWQQRIVPKDIVASRNKITELAKIGVDVNSETAKNLVLFLSDMERLNAEDIPEVRATAKMGWTEDGFMPYSSELAFDKDGRFDTLFSTISFHGSRDKYIKFVKEVRRSGRVEPRLVMAASLASILIKPCGLLPFWVDIWGKTGGGKSICGMLAASVWADPEIGKYISKFDSTISAFEARAGFLNHLPFVIDDTAEIRRRMRDDFSQLIYQLASGEGRERSNTKLGLAHKTTWSNVIICSGESPIITDNLQGGAVNRVIEYEVDDGDIFPDGQYAATLLRSNYGFLGKEFVQLIEDIGIEKLTEIQRECFNAIKSDKYEDKQLLSISAVITADMLATEFIFKDGMTLSFADIEKALTDKNVMSENERCYEYILGEVAVNEKKFTPNEYGDYIGECWGKTVLEDNGKTECIAILTNAFHRICESGGYSHRAFTSWAIKKGIIYPDTNGKASKPVRLKEFDGSKRCIVLKVPTENE